MDDELEKDALKAPSEISISEWKYCSKLVDPKATEGTGTRIVHYADVCVPVPDSIFDSIRCEHLKFPMKATVALGRARTPGKDTGTRPEPKPLEIESEIGIEIKHLILEDLVKKT